MSIPCPHCQRPLTPGDRFCTACGSSLLLEVAPGSTEPTCAVHPRMKGLGVCSRCGAFACASCLHANPQGLAICASCHEREPDVLLPWDRREELGTFKAFYKTCVEVLLRPGPTFSESRTEGTVGSSLLFSLLCGFLAFFTTGIVYAVFFGAMSMALPSDTGEGPSPSEFRWIMVAMMGAWIVLAPVMAVVTTVVNAAIDHLVLRMCGVTRGFQVTLRANALSQAPYALGVVPICGAQVAPIWTMVARVFAYRGQHRTTWGVAALGALLAPMATLCLCGSAYVAMLVFIMNNKV